MKRSPAILLLLPFLLTACSGPGEGELKEEALRRYPPDHPFPGSEFMYVDGARLHVRRWEPDPGVYRTAKGIVFLVHGVSGSTYNWRFLAPALADDGYRVLTADLPPFGFSGEPQPDGVSFDPLPKDSVSRAVLLWDLFDTVYGTQSSPSAIVGHSLGGRIAAFMALSKPERVPKLVLLAPAVFGSSVIPAFTRYRPFTEVAVKNAEGTAGNLPIVRTILDKAYGMHATDDDLVGNWAPFLRSGAAEACADWAGKSVETEPPPVQLIATPTLILWSRRDAIVFNQGEKLQKEMQHARYLEVPGGSHCLMDTASDIVTPAVLEFLGND